jgi:hypothetical protein
MDTLPERRMLDNTQRRQIISADAVTVLWPNRLWWCQKVSALERGFGVWILSNEAMPGPLD